MATVQRGPPDLSQLTASTAGDSLSYEHLPGVTSFRVLELLPGLDTEPITCRLHIVQWDNSPHYEAISYAWGDPNARMPILCDGKLINITRTLHEAFLHLRLSDRPRVMWADALCINQQDVRERGLQVKQMKRIYEKAQNVQVWLGPDNSEYQAETAVNAMHTICDFLCEKLGIGGLDHDVQTETYQEILLKNRDKLPLPNENNFSSDALWKSLVWFYSHRYFTRVWAIQEVSANTNRVVNIGNIRTSWNHVDLVASYIIMEPAFSDDYGFADAYCWWVATVAELALQPERWLNMLYLASNYGCLDARDVIYGLRGLMKLAKGGTLLDPDYKKSTEEVYRDAVEAALLNFKKTDVLSYVTGEEDPSWIPRWDVSMLFRNPFRFGKPMPWKPANDTEAVWSIDRSANVLTLSGFIAGTIEFTKTYNQLWFANSTMDSDQGKQDLRRSWIEILHMFGDSQEELPLSRPFLTAASVSLSFGLNHKLNALEQSDLLHQFVAYLLLVVGDESKECLRYIPQDLIEESKSFDRRVFGKPVWDFQYPDASIFITQEKLVGCAIATTQKDDVVFVALGSTYPVVLRPLQAREGQQNYNIRGFSYVHGVMMGELAQSKSSDISIQ